MCMCVGLVQMCSVLSAAFCLVDSPQVEIVTGVHWTAGGSVEDEQSINLSLAAEVSNNFVITDEGQVVSLMHLDGV